MIAFVCTSSAPNGSSISRIDGSLISAAARLDALAHAARELVRVVVLEAGEADAAQPVAARWPAPASSATPRKHRPEATLPSTVFHGSSASVWNMKLVPRVMPVDRLAADADRAGARPVQAGHQRQRRRLAAPGRPDDRAELARLDDQVDVAQRGERRARRGDEPLGHAAQLDLSARLGAARASRSTPSRALGRLACVLATVIGLLSHWPLSFASICEVP